MDDGQGAGRGEKMKMLFCVLMMVLTLVSLAACGGKNEANSQTPSPPDPQSRLTEKQPASEPDLIDIDLTKFSSNMVYAESAGKITRAEISREPTRFIASTMITATTTAISKL